MDAEAPLPGSLKVTTNYATDGLVVVADYVAIILRKRPKQ